MSSIPAQRNVARGEVIHAAVANWTHFVEPQSVLGTCLISALVVVLYYRVIANLVIDWWQIPDHSHGFLVPVFSGYLVWSRRAAIRETELTPAWTGVAVIAFGLSLLLLGDFGANLLLSRISIVILLTGFVISFGGWKLLHQIGLPLFVLLFAIPIPALLLNQVTLPLQMLASRVASDVLPVFGAPVLREGNVIQLPTMKLEVAEACSGIRSLVSLSVMALFYGYFTEKSNVRRILLVLLSAPIAVAANSLRIVGTGLCVQYWDPELALGFFHEFSGWVMFLVSLVCLFLMQRIMSRVWKTRRQP